MTRFAKEIKQCIRGEGCTGSKNRKKNSLCEVVSNMGKRVKLHDSKTTEAEEVAIWESRVPETGSSDLSAPITKNTKINVTVAECVF